MIAVQGSCSDGKSATDDTHQPVASKRVTWEQYMQRRRGLDEI